jgi:dCMP deaminase
MSKPNVSADSQRPSWDEYFSRIAAEVSKRATCLRRRVGAILVLDKRILATGYNGAPRGLRHCNEAGCLRAKQGVPSGERHELCRGLHAEMNVLIQAASHGIRVEGATLYSTSFPCSLCAKMIINGGIRRVVAQSDYADPLAKELLAEAKVKTEAFDSEHGKTKPFLMRRSQRPRRALRGARRPKASERKK